MPIDRILTAGTIITMDPSAPRAQALAISDGTVVAVGSLAVLPRDVVNV